MGNGEAPGAAAPIGETDKIEILLREYDSLRAEILQRNSVLNNVLTVAGTAFLVIVGISVQVSNIELGVWLTLILVFLVLIGQIIVQFDTLAAAARVREIESEVNARAGGEKLLRWETDHGLYRVGYFDRFKIPGAQAPPSHRKLQSGFLSGLVVVSLLICALALVSYLDHAAR